MELSLTARGGKYLERVKGGHGDNRDLKAINLFGVSPEMQYKSQSPYLSKIRFRKVRGIKSPILESSASPRQSPKPIEKEKRIDTNQEEFDDVKKILKKSEEKQTRVLQMKKSYLTARMYK